MISVSSRSCLARGVCWCRPRHPVVGALLQRADAPHQVAFVQTLQRIIGRTRCSSTRTSSMPSSLVVLIVEGRGVAKALAASRVQRVGTRVSADHLETQAGNAGLQLARDLIE